MQFQGAQPDHVRVESSCFSEFVRPRELVSFDPRQVTRSLSRKTYLSWEVN